VCPSYRGAELLEIVPVELALAVRSGSVLAHSDDELAQGGGRKKKKEEEEEEEGAALFIKI